MKNLHLHMEKKKLSQSELARLMGVSQPTVWHWLNGSKFPRPAKLLKLADLTGLTTDKLMDRA